MAHIVVEETFDPPISEEVHNHLVQALKPCLELRDATWLGSHMAKDRTRCVCVFEAKDAQSVREAYQRAGFKVDRVWAAEPWLPPTP